ncbi:MAG: flavodoxin domain-containing protein [Lachnospiraceae bacterium]|nr:flavodoxin domain-containing protein [Lachnospiraceae bacterium]
MKTAIVYYSMSGNTKYAADKIAEKIGADIIRIEPVKAYPDQGAKKFIWGGKSAVMGEPPALQSYEFSAEKYDRIILGTPVWASTFASPIRSFLKENPDIQGKKLAVFTCFSGGGADKVIEKMEKYIGIEEFEAELILVDPKENVKAENDEKIDVFCDMVKQNGK